LQLYKLKTLQISNNDLNNLDPRLSLLPDLLRLSIEGNPLRSIKPAMRSANAV
jgi:Leucine-rich repeat (LRR) protein